jgi:hypothetical protein
MECRCGNRGFFEEGKQVLCQGCFIRQFEKRVKKALRMRPLVKGEKVKIVGSLAMYLFKKIVHVPVVEGSDVVFDEWTMDDSCDAFLRWLGGGKFVESSAVHILQYVSDKDAAVYATLKGISFVAKEKDKDWLAFMEKFKDYPEMKRNLLRNVLEMKGMVGK